MTMAQLCARRYRMLRRQRRCVDCTAKLPPGWTFMRCHPHLVQRRPETRDRRERAAVGLPGKEGE